MPLYYKIMGKVILHYGKCYSCLVNGTALIGVSRKYLRTLLPNSK